MTTCSVSDRHHEGSFDWSSDGTAVFGNRPLNTFIDLLTALSVFNYLSI